MSTTLGRLNGTTGGLSDTILVSDGTTGKLVKTTTTVLKNTNTTWNTGVGVTVNLGVLNDGYYTALINYIIRRTAGGTDVFKDATFHAVLIRTAGTMVLSTNADQNSIGSFAPTQGWAASGDTLVHTITSAGSSGTVSYNINLIYRGSM